MNTNLMENGKGGMDHRGKLLDLSISWLSAYFFSSGALEIDISDIYLINSRWIHVLSCLHCLLLRHQNLF